MKNVSLQISKFLMHVEKTFYIAPIIFCFEDLLKSS